MWSVILLGIYIGCTLPGRMLGLVLQRDRQWHHNNAFMGGNLTPYGGATAAPLLLARNTTGARNKPSSKVIAQVGHSGRMLPNQSTRFRRSAANTITKVKC